MGEQSEEWRVKSGIWHMFCISNTRADRGKMVLFLESAGQIYPETGLTFEAPKCVLASVIVIPIRCISIGRQKGFFLREANVTCVETHFILISLFTIS